MTAPHAWSPDRSGYGCDDCPLPKSHPIHGAAEATPVQLATADHPRDGANLTPAMDESRLNAQGRKVWRLMADGAWHTLAALADNIGASEQSVSARVRDFRKAEFGGHEVARRLREGSSQWEYRLTPRMVTTAPTPPEAYDEPLIGVG